MTTNKSNHRFLIIALFLVITIDTMGIGFVWPLFGTLFTGKDTALFSSSVSMEWRNILYGIAIGIASLCQFLSAPILGKISDHIGRRKTLLFCLFGTAFGMLASAAGIILNSVTLIIVSRAWLGATAASQAIAQASIIDISDRKNKSARLGVISSATNIGYIFGPVLSSLLIDKSIVGWFSLTTPFYFAAILATFSALFLLKTYKKKDKIHSTTKTKISEKLLVFAKAFTNKDIRTTALTYLSLQAGWALYLQTNFLSLIQNHNYNNRMLGYYLSWLGIVFCFNLLVMVRIVTRHVALKKIVYTSLSIATICCLSNIVFDSIFSIWLNLFFMASSIAIGSNAILTTLSNTAKESEQGWIMGVGESLSSLAWALVPPAIGFLLALNFTIPLMISVAMFFIGTLAAIFKFK